MAARLTVAELVDRGDLDELLRRIDELCDGRNWNELIDLRDRCRAAFQRGRQLWPAASHAEYRLALEAPGRWAAAVVQPGAGHFALGPLSEVAASTHTWEELAPHLEAGPAAALVAQERIIRGEDLTGDRRVDTAVTDLPLRLAPWEPAYPVATYRPYGAEFGDVPAPSGWSRLEGPPGAAVDGVEATEALVELAHVWTSQSNGRVAVVAVSGDARGAIRALGGVRATEVDTAGAFAVMAWTAASGGAHGRRRGMAHGRFAAWWAAAAVAGALDAWPNVGEALGGVRWYRWERDEPPKGWWLRLAAERPSAGRAWAVEAIDRR